MSLQAAIEFLFWLLLVLATYSYFIYPVLLSVLLRVRRARLGSDEMPMPTMSLVITAFNEQARIGAKIQNAIAIDYPDLEILVASDCSTDQTDDIVKSHQKDNVRLVRAAQRLGKENAQECAIREARGEVIVFSDVATQIPPDAFRKLAVYFQDSGVGAVSSEDRFIDQGGVVAGENAYVRYEMGLRRLESQLAGLVGLSGSFFAARAAVCRQWDIHSPSDFNTALNCARIGLRAVTAPDVLGYYKDLKDPKMEYQRKVRTVLRGITSIVRHSEVLNPLRFGLFAWQVWSHKVMRWAVPWLLLALFVLNLLLLGKHWIYQLSMVGQLVFYGVAAMAHFSPRMKEQIGPVRIVYFFAQVNVAIASACCRFMTGKRMTTWQPSAR